MLCKQNKRSVNAIIYLVRHLEAWRPCMNKDLMNCRVQKKMTQMFRSEGVNIERLERLHSTFPKNKRVRGDLIEVVTLNGRHVGVISYNLDARHHSPVPGL